MEAKQWRLKYRKDRKIVLARLTKTKEPVLLTNRLLYSFEQIDLKIYSISILYDARSSTTELRINSEWPFTSDLASLINTFADRV